MPKQVTFNQFPNSGIAITWTPSRQGLSIHGWYDTYVGIEGEDITLGEFFKRLNITEKDCLKAFKTINQQEDKWKTTNNELLMN